MTSECNTMTKLAPNLGPADHSLLSSLQHHHFLYSQDDVLANLLNQPRGGWEGRVSLPSWSVPEAHARLCWNAFKSHEPYTTTSPDHKSWQWK